MKQDLWKYSILEILKGYKEKKFSPLEVANEIVRKIERDNQKLNAYVFFDEEIIIKQATISQNKYEKNKIRGILEGVPISIKDLIVTDDMPTKRGTLTSSLSSKSDFDAPVVKKLKEQGAIILGKTASPEFGHKGTTQSKKYGNTNNPWDLSLNAGGSSGGSSAAVAGGLGPASIGTDGGGSIRIPCSFCGLFGHKPTFGRVPAYPISPFGSIANLGPITRTVKDSGILMNVISGPDSMDWNSLPYQNTDYTELNMNLKKNFKIGYSKFWGMKNFFETSLIEIEVLEKIEETIETLRKNGLQILEMDTIDWPHNPLEIFMVLWQVGAANLARKISKEDYEKLEPTFQNFIEEGKKITLSDYMDAEVKRAENASQIKKIFQDLEAIIGPTLPVLPFDTNSNVPDGFKKDQLFSWLPFTYPFNLTKNPASTINVNFSGSGLPVGLQIVTDTYEDKTCFELAFFIEKTMGLTDKWPSF